MRKKKRKPRPKPRITLRSIRNFTRVRMSTVTEAAAQAGVKTERGQRLTRRQARKILEVIYIRKGAWACKPLFGNQTDCLPRIGSTKRK